MRTLQGKVWVMLLTVSKVLMGSWFDTEHLLFEMSKEHLGFLLMSVNTRGGSGGGNHAPRL